MVSAREATTPAKSRARRLAPVAVAVLLVVTVAAVVVPLMQTGTAEFFSRYHLLERRYVNLENSAHEGIGCRSCHETEPLENGLALIADYYTSYFRQSEVPAYFSFGPPENDACLACHETDWSSEPSRTAQIPHPAHTRVASETRQCSSCHKWTGHFESYMEKHKEMPLSGVCVAYGCHVGTKSAEECFDCHHVLLDESAQWPTQHSATVSQTGQNVCLEACHTVAQCQQCHTTGTRPEFDGDPIETSMKSIEMLHVKPEWTELYHGEEALKGRDRCILCHQDEGECGECHLQRPAFHGAPLTWIGRHSKVTDSIDDPGCLECHEKPWCEDCHSQFEEMG